MISDQKGMPFRISIPLPGPVSWSPGRRRHSPSGGHGQPLLTPEQAEQAARAAGRAADRIDAARERLDEREQQSREAHQERMAELGRIRELPPWERFKAAMRGHR